MYACCFFVVAALLVLLIELADRRWCFGLPMALSSWRIIEKLKAMKEPLSVKYIWECQEERSS